MPVMAISKFERFFRLAASLDVDKSDIKRYADFVNQKIYDLLLMGVATARANDRDIVQPWDLPITKDLQENIQNEHRGKTYTFTRGWVVWHVIEHDLHHGAPLEAGRKRREGFRTHIRSGHELDVGSVRHGPDHLDGTGPQAGDTYVHTAGGRDGARCGCGTARHGRSPTAEGMDGTAGRCLGNVPPSGCGG